MTSVVGRTPVIGRALTVTALVLVNGIGTPLLGQANPGFKIPIEVFQGFGSRETGQIRPYLASIAAIPGYATSTVRFGLRLSYDYENPGKTVRVGPRVEVPVKMLIANIGLVLGAEAAWNNDGDARVGGGFTFDADGLLRAGVWGGWDRARSGRWFGVTIGLDPTSWFGGVHSSVNPDEQDGDDR